MTSEYYLIKTGYGPLHIHINFDDTGPKQIFCNLPPLGTEISGLAASTGILISKYLEIGGDPRRLIKHLNSVKGDKPIGFGENRVDSIPHAISVALKIHLDKHPTVEPPPTSVQLEVHNTPNPDYFSTAHISAADGPKITYYTQSSGADHCPECYSPNLKRESGCLSCLDCNYSKCS